jgi:hypothetical protein
LSVFNLEDIFLLRERGLKKSAQIFDEKHQKLQRLDLDYGISHSCSILLISPYFSPSLDFTHRRRHLSRGNSSQPCGTDFKADDGKLTEA